MLLFEVTTKNSQNCGKKSFLKKLKCYLKILICDGKRREKRELVDAKSSHNFREQIAFLFSGNKGLIKLSLCSAKIRKLKCEKVIKITSETLKEIYF